MPRTRVKLVVFVDLDPMPGEFHTKELAGQAVQRILQDRIPHYDPNVIIPPVSPEN